MNGTEYRRLKIAHDTALGMYCLAKQGFVHLDLKTSNLLVHENIRFILFLLVIHSPFLFEDES
jgi:serine/threonine protein kinase